METILNHELKLYSEWLIANRLSLNVDKTKLLVFQSKIKQMYYGKFSIRLNGFKLLPSTHSKYLTLYLDYKLTWEFHRKQISNKLSRANGVLFKLRNFCPKEVLINVYHSIFYSHLTYGFPVWTLTTKTNIETIIV